HAPSPARTPYAPSTLTYIAHTPILALTCFLPSSVAHRYPHSFPTRRSSDLFTLVDIFAEPAVRMRLLLTFIMSLSVTIGYWGVSTFVPAYVGLVAAAGGLPPPYYAAFVGLVQNIGGLIRFSPLRFFAPALGR